MVDNTLPLAIGQSSSAGYFNGTIDEVALYNVALTAAQLQNHYAAGAEAPANVSPPTVSGTAQTGQTLTAGPGVWTGSQPITYGYQWRRCDSTGGACTDITAATGTTYTLSPGDAGSTIRVLVTAANAAGTVTAISAATALVAAPPVCSPRSSSYSAAVLGTAGVVGYWRLGEGSGTVACDSKGANNGGYQAGTTLGRPGALAGDPDTAVAFDGSAGWVQVAHDPSLNVGDRFSVEAWVKRGSVGGPGNQVVVSKQGGAWVLMFNPSNQLVLRRAGVADVASSTATVTDTGGWHYVAATKDGASVHLYLDGADVTGTVTNQTMVDNTLPLAIGQSSSAGYFNGTIDEVALYNVALTAAQLQNHYWAGLPPAQPPANSSAPTISGTAQQGQTLSANPGTWSGTQPISYAYQWRRCDLGADACIDIVGATAASYTLGTADVGSTIRVSVTASNRGGSASASSTATGAVAASTSPPGDPVVAAAGDIACDPAAAAFNGGLGTTSECRQQYTSDLLVGQGLAAVLALGDNQYECGGYDAFMQAYDPTWGRVKDITHPVPGNHEYQTSGGTGCDAAGNAAGYFDYFGPAAGQPGQGYYSFDVGSWHLIALNSNCFQVGGCGVGSPEETWLRADLAAHSNTCTLAYWHHPRFTSGQVGSDAEVAPFWQDIYSAGVDVVLNGHAHGYERFAPQDPGENYDPTRGIREFVVGTGGEDFHAFTVSMPLTESRDGYAFGVLKLTLHAGSYDWQFVSEAGQTYADSGSTFCH
jgi:hypothetical protein